MITTLRKPLIVGVVLALLLALVGTGWATTYYVNGSGAPYVGTQGTYAIGNDTTGNGSLATPWASLTKALAGGSDGDIIYVAAATYTENGPNSCWYANARFTWIADGTAIVRATGAATRVVYVASSGTGSSFTDFTFDGENRNSVIDFNSSVLTIAFTNCTFKNGLNYLIHGTNAITSFTSTGCSYILSAGQAIYNCIGAGGTANITGNSFTGTTASIYALIDNEYTSTVNFLGNNIDVTTAGYLFYLSSGVHNIGSAASPNTINIAGTPTNFLKTDYGSGTTNLLSNTITSVATSADFFLSSQRVVATWAVNVVNNNIAISGTTFNKNVIKAINPTSFIASGNTIDLRESLTFASAAIWVNSTGLTVATTSITNNIIKVAHQDGYGILVGTETSTAGDEKINGAVITGNDIYGPTYYSGASSSGGHGITVGYNKNATIAGNYCNGYMIGILFKSHGLIYASGGAFDNLVINNLATAGIYIKGTQNVSLINNMIYNDPAIAQTAYGIQVAINGDGGALATGATLQNNTIWVKDTCETIQVDADSTTGLTSDCNLFWSNTGVVNFVAGGSTYATFALWQAAGYDAHSKNADPKFVSLSGGNFRLGPGSPGISSGSATAAPRTMLDYEGKLLWGDRGAPPIGPYANPPGAGGN